MKRKAVTLPPHEIELKFQLLPGSKRSFAPEISLASRHKTGIRSQPITIRRTTCYSHPG